MSTSNRVFSDLFEIENFVKQTAISQGKILLIDALREHFRKDVYYKYGTDAFGFPITPDHTDLPTDLNEERTTRIFIGDIFRMDKRYLPSITIRQSGGSYYAISFNQNETTKYRVDLVLDGYGNRSLLKVPTHKVYAGAWTQNFQIMIASESTPDREELSDIVSSFLISAARLPTQDAGLFIKNVSFGGESEEDWANEKIYIQNINIETFSEWRREVPIDGVVETLNFCFDFGLFGTENFSGTSAVLTTEDSTLEVSV